MTKKIFITGIGTDIGKTLVAAIVCESLQADYWKPIQAGDIETGDKHRVETLLTNKLSKIHDNSYSLSTPMSPHGAAVLDNVVIDMSSIKAPKTNNHLVIEGAGGLLVPLNDKQTILDIIKPGYQVIVVSKHYLGSINHSLMTIKLLQEKGFDVSVIFNGEENLSSESIIQSMTKVKVIGRLSPESVVNKEMISRYATLFNPKLLQLIL